MSDSVEQLAADFTSNGWKCSPYERAVALIESDVHAAYRLVEVFSQDIHSAPTFLSYAIDRLPYDAFEGLVVRALQRFRDDSENEAAEKLLASASLQKPESLHPHLNEIFELRPNWQAYYAQWPWRESGAAHFKELLGRLNTLPNESDTDSREPEAGYVMKAMLESRYLPALDYVRKNSGLNASLLLKEVGFEFIRGQFHKLYPDRSCHLVFPNGYFRDSELPIHLVKRHATWNLGHENCWSARFGGLGSSECGSCGQPLHHLLTLNTGLDQVGISRLSSVSFETCLSCLGWEQDAGTLFYEHDAHGYPRSLKINDPQLSPRFPASPLRETAVAIAITPARYRWQDWALANSRENLNRIGGHPCWIQGAAYIECPCCEKTMSFCFQLDSELPCGEDGTWLWGSGGCCYVSWCDDCQVSGFQWQCT
jgi:hypothetical protein